MSIRTPSVLVLLSAAAFLAAAASSSEPAVRPGASGAGEGSPRAAPAAEDPEALELGRKVLAVRRAIEDPSSPGAMKAVTDLGLDQRYYVLVRGWLSQQLAADRSLADANKERTPRAVLDRIDFLQKAIRAIDLE